MNLIDELQRQVASTPETEIIAIVSARGVAGGSVGSGSDLWILVLSTSGWRQLGGNIIDSELDVRKPVSKQELVSFQKAVKPFDILRLRVRLAKTGSFPRMQALLIESFGKDNSDPELIAYAKKLQEPVTFQDAQFGLFTLDRRVDWYKSTTEWAGSKIRLTIDGNTPEAINECLAVARVLWTSQREWQQKVTNCAIGKLLHLKNDAWLGEDESELTAEEFAKKMVLESITTRVGGYLEFWHNDGDLFWGHSILVSGNLKDGPMDAGIEG